MTWDQQAQWGRAPRLAAAPLDRDGMVFRWRRAGEPSRPIRNCYWVETSRLLAGGYPCLRGEDASRKVLRKFLDEGIRQ